LRKCATTRDTRQRSEKKQKGVNKSEKELKRAKISEKVKGSEKEVETQQLAVAERPQDATYFAKKRDNERYSSKERKGTKSSKTAKRSDFFSFQF